MREKTPEQKEYEAYYQEISEGCGCTELWEYLSERRQESSGIGYGQ
jgi:hypothetical protein